MSATSPHSKRDFNRSSNGWISLGGLSLEINESQEAFFERGSDEIQFEATAETLTNLIDTEGGSEEWKTECSVGFYV